MRRDEGYPGAAIACPLGERDTLATAAAVAQETHRIEGFAGSPGRDQHLSSHEVQGCE